MKKLKKIEDWEINTPNGWSDFEGIKKTIKHVFYVIKIDHYELICSSNHKIRTTQGYKYASLLSLNDFVFTKEGFKKITLLEKIESDIELYDLIDVKKNNEYWTNNIASHNCAFIPGMPEIWSAAQPTLSTGGDCIALSTPAGIGNWFHKTWVQAVEGEKFEMSGKTLGFHPILLHWSLHPERDQTWATQMKSRIGERTFAIEHDCSFEQSGNNVIEVDSLNWYKSNPIETPHICEPLEKTGLNKNLWIWEHPDINKEYLISGDVARGDGEDYSAFHVIDVENYEQVAEFKGQITTDIFAQLLMSVGFHYNKAFIACENNSIGHGVCVKLLESEYRNIYWTVKDPSKLNTENYYQFDVDLYNPPQNATPGFSTTGRTRPIIISRLEEDIRNKDFIFHSERFYNECLTFIYDKGKPQAMSGYNDDLVISAAIGAYVRYSKLCLFGFGKKDKIFSRVYTNANVSTIPGGIINNSHKQHASKNFMINIHGEREDLRWLIG